MGANTAIEWAESTWNPLTGCTKISPGCKNCYAERMSNRLKLMGQPNYRNGFELSLHEHALGLPLTWKKPQPRKPWGSCHSIAAHSPSAMRLTGTQTIWAAANSAANIARIASRPSTGALAT